MRCVVASGQEELDVNQFQAHVVGALAGAELSPNTITALLSALTELGLNDEAFGRIITKVQRFVLVTLRVCCPVL